MTYDSYRFINGHLATHYRRQVRPDAEQPTLHVDDLLQRLDVRTARYHALRAALERLSLGSYERRPDGRIVLYEPGVGGTPWTAGYLFGPGGKTSGMSEFMTYRRLAPRWASIVQG